MHHVVVASESGHHHKHCRVGEVEVAHKRGSHGEIVGREDELVCPAVVGLQVAAHAHCSGHATQHACAYGADLLFCVFCGIYGVDKLVRYYELLRVHAVFGEVFHVDFAEVAKAAVLGQECLFDAFYFKAFEQFAREVCACCGSYYGSFVASEYALVALGVLGFDLPPRWLHA